MNFSSLPPELRQDIWKLTFEPRILCIHMYRRMAPKYDNPDGDWQVMDEASRRTLAISFTATALTPGSDEKTVPRHVYHARAKMLPEMKRFKVRDLDAAKKLATISPGPTSLGPVSLYVCSESRAIAMKRYEYAFKGKKIGLSHENPHARADWKRRKLSQRGIWVDFERDVVFIDSIAPEDRRRDSLCPTLQYSELGWFVTCAQQEAERITRLAVGGPWSKVSHIKQTLHLLQYGQRLSPAQLLAAPLFIKSLLSLRELLVDDGFSLSKKRNPQLHYGIPGDRQQAEAEILSWLRGPARAKRSPESFWESLEVRIVRGDENEWKLL